MATNSAGEARADQERFHNPENEEIGVVMGVPSRGKVRIEWSIMMRSLQAPVNGSLQTKTIIDAPVAAAREEVAKWAIEHNARYLFFVDDDVLIPQNGLRRLVYLLDNNPEWDVVSGIYVTKVNPDQLPPDRPEPLIFGGEVGRPGAFWDWKLDEIFPIWGCGMGCCLIRVDAFSKIDPPYFAFEDSVDGMDSHSIGEDLYFCTKLHKAGGKLMADGGLLCGHIDGEGRVHSMPMESKPIQEADSEVLQRYKLYDQVLEEKGKKARTEKRRVAGIAGN